MGFTLLLYYNIINYYLIGGLYNGIIYVLLIK